MSLTGSAVAGVAAAAPAEDSSGAPGPSATATSSKGAISKRQAPGPVRDTNDAVRANGRAENRSNSPSVPAAAAVNSTPNTAAARQQPAGVDTSVAQSDLATSGSKARLPVAKAKPRRPEAAAAHSVAAVGQSQVAVAAPVLDRPTPPAIAAARSQLAGLFDVATHWLDTLPANPVTGLVQGALLLVRRALLPTGTTVAPGVTNGQTATDPYFTELQLRDYLLNLAKQQYGGLFGQTVPQYNYEYYYLRDAASGIGGAPAAGGGTTSGTNTQVAGVDEADFVETDGTNLYVSRNGALTIIDRDLNVRSQVALSGNVVGSFLSGNKLTVITQNGYGGWYGPGMVGDFAMRMPYMQWDPKTTVTVFDVSDIGAPIVTSQTMLDGSFRDARAVNGTVYVVLDSQFKLPPPNYTETPVDPTVEVDEDPLVLEDGPIAAKPAYWWNPEITSYRTYETWDEYVARVGDQIVNQAVPHYYSVDADGNAVDLGALLGADDIVRPDVDTQSSVVTVVSVDSAGSGLSDAIGRVVPNSGNAIYMTPDALYVATPDHNYSDTRQSTDTRIDRFAIKGTDIGWQASGVVSGTLINQFAMDEQDGYLRVATHTTSSQWIANSPGVNQDRGYWQSRNDNGVYVFDTKGNVLDLVGSVTGLAPGEQIYAARFVGDKAYLVTFLQTDPLFVIDLAGPTAPTLQGELVIPGFSNYLQPVGDGLLLGIGQERPAGSWNNYLHASLFDVSTGTAPAQIDREFLAQSSQWSWSEAQYDHHAVLFSPEDGLLVLPVAGNGYDSSAGTYRYDQFLSVLRVDADGITVLGEIHTDEPVIRTVRIGDVLYAVSDNQVTAYSLTDFSKIGTSNINL
jgi:uncharacterized secreted protein with C-terminal beta-propeller domain